MTSGPGHDRRERGGDRFGTKSVRIDVWLVAVRLVKTRAVAASACRAGRVTINGHIAKPASTVSVGDLVEASLAERRRVVEVVTPATKRTSAPIAQTCYVDHSPPPPSQPPARVAQRDRGAGRPTKRDRRQIDRLRGR